MNIFQIIWKLNDTWIIIHKTLNTLNMDISYCVWYVSNGTNIMNGILKNKIDMLVLVDIFSVSKFSMKIFQGLGLYLIHWQWWICLPIYIYIYILNSSSSAVFWKRLCTCWTKATWQLISISTSFVSAGHSQQWYVYSGKTGFCLFYYCAVLCCTQILEFILAKWSYSFVCTLYYLIIIIMQKYLKLLNFKNTCQVHSVERVCA